MDDFPTKTIIYKGFSMAMLVITNSSSSVATQLSCSAHQWRFEKPASAHSGSPTNCWKFYIGLVLEILRSIELN